MTAEMRSWLRIFLPLLSLLLLAGSRSGGPAENLLPDPGFRQLSRHWQVRFPEANETKYANNHKAVRLATSRAGVRCLEFRLDQGTAASQGVKTCSKLIAVQPGRAYTFGVSFQTEGPKPIVFLEGYRVAPGQELAGDNHYPGFERIYRATIQPQPAAGEWQTVQRTVKPPPRYQPSHLLLKLYAYWPAGTIRFRDPFLCSAP
jgi:hypothetical protein